MGPAVVVPHSAAVGHRKRVTVAVCGGGDGGGDGFARAGAHGLGDDLQPVRAGQVLLLLVLFAAVVLQEELARLLQHAATLTDGTVGKGTRG